MSTFHFDYHRMIVGYHGCDRELIEKIILDGEPIKPSVNRWDWLGKGIYFWEYGPQRAFEFAQEQQARDKVQNPAILGAYIHLGHCFDLTDTRNTSQLTDAFERWEQTLTSQGKSLPINKKGGGGGDDLLLRFRDCSLLNWYMEWLDHRAGECYYQTVRGVFVEGQPAFPDSAIFEKTHVQIAVRDPSCIMGYFLPRPLNEEEYDE